VFFNEDGTEMTVLQVHPDAASMEYHMKMAGPAFRAVAEFIAMRRMDVYGKPSEDLLAMLRQKAQMLGNVPVGLHDHHAGFARLPAT
jgi:hypothetical protein